MAAPETHNFAVFCDFENVAIGLKEGNFPDFKIRPVLERLLLKGSIVVKKAYCDWDRYRDYKRDLHEAAFELIEIPHVRQSGKNSADIRMVVDALDLCYTKSHIDAFVIISGDSDFSPLISKLKENGKSVIGIGVRGSASSLLISNCDEFIFYEDLVQAKAARTRSRSAGWMWDDRSSKVTLARTGMPHRPNAASSMTSLSSSTFQDHRATPAASSARFRLSASQSGAIGVVLSGI